MDVRFEVRDDILGTHEGFDLGEALRQRRSIGLAFQRILRRHQPDDAVEPQPHARRFGDMAMAFMGRIERAAEQADLHAAFQVEPGAQGARAHGSRHGRQAGKPHQRPPVRRRKENSPRTPTRRCPRDYSRRTRSAFRPHPQASCPKWSRRPRTEARARLRRIRRKSCAASGPRRV